MTRAAPQLIERAHAYVIVNAEQLEAKLAIFTRAPSFESLLGILSAVYYFGQVGGMPPQLRAYQHAQTYGASHMMLLVRTFASSDDLLPGCSSTAAASLCKEFLLERFKRYFNASCTAIAGYGRATSFLDNHMIGLADDPTAVQETCIELLTALFQRRYVQPSCTGPFVRAAAQNVPAFGGLIRMDLIQVAATSCKIYNLNTRFYFQLERRTIFDLAFALCYVIVKKEALLHAATRFSESPTVEIVAEMLKCIVYYGFSMSIAYDRWQNHRKLASSHFAMIVVRRHSLDSPRPAFCNNPGDAAFFDEHMLERLSGAFNGECENNAGNVNGSKWFSDDLFERAADESARQELLLLLIGALANANFVEKEEVIRRFKVSSRHTASYFRPTFALFAMRCFMSEKKIVDHMEARHHDRLSEYVLLPTISKNIPRAI